MRQVSVRVFPVPAADGVDIALAGPITPGGRLAVYDASGREIAMLPVPTTPGTNGEVRVVWTARHRSGVALPAGVYFVRLERPDGGGGPVGRMILLR